MSGATDDTVDFRHTDLTQKSTRYYRSLHGQQLPRRKSAVQRWLLILR